MIFSGTDVMRKCQENFISSYPEREDDGTIDKIKFEILN
jgi:hypothetical protein